MKRIIALIVAMWVIAIVALPDVAWAKGYGAQNLGGSTYITWSSINIDVPSRSANQSNPVLLGYVCLTQDTLASTTRSGLVNRYAVYTKPHTDTKVLKPLNGITIAPADDGFIAEDSSPAPVERLWSQAKLTSSKTWFLDIAVPESVGLACVNGGIAGAIDELERTHATSIRRK